MAILSHALPFQGYPEEESTHVLVLDTNSQHPHKGTHPFTMSLQRMTVCTYTCGVVPAHPECIEGRCLRDKFSNTRLSTAKHRSNAKDFSSLQQGSPNTQSQDVQQESQGQDHQEEAPEGYVQCLRYV